MPLMKPEDLPLSVQQTARRFGMDLSRSLAMVSGGPDSVAMLRALVDLGVKPVVLHVDHGLRGVESREDARFVRGLCERLGVPCEVRGVSLGGGNVQEAARRERYRLAEEISEERGLSAVSTGHTVDDVAETVLMNLARGAGLRGLSGIPPVRGRYVRPLIECRRIEVLAYLKHLDQPYRTDPTNLTPKYARNRVRLEVLPILEDLHPGAGGNIARGAALLREDLEALDGLVAALVHRRGEEEEEEVVVPLDAFFREAPLPLKRHAVRRAHAFLAPEGAYLDSEAVAVVLDLATKREGTRTVSLPGNVVAALRYGEELVLYRVPREPSVLGEEEAELRPGGFGYGGWGVDVREVPGLDPSDAARTEVAYLDVGKGPYWVRMAREGDEIRPLGLGGTKKVFRAMMDRKVPKDLRRRTPVVVDGWGKVVWIFGGELSEEFKVGQGTEKMLRVEVRENR